MTYLSEGKIGNTKYNNYMSSGCVARYELLSRHIFHFLPEAASSCKNFRLVEIGYMCDVKIHVIYVHDLIVYAVYMQLYVTVI